MGRIFNECRILASLFVKNNRFVTVMQRGVNTNRSTFKGPLQYLFRPLLGKKEFAVTQHMYAFNGPNLDNIH